MGHTQTDDTRIGLAAYRCGCRVTGIQADPIKAVAYATGVNIEWCPTHAAAPQMLADEQAWVEQAESWLLLINGPKYGAVRLEMRRRIAAARAILRAVTEGGSHG